MSNVAIRAALEVHLAAMTPTLDTAWENAQFQPPALGTPYQAVFLMFADPDNPEMGAGYRDQGYMQINLVYPQNAGTAAAAARAKEIRDRFYKNLTLSNSGYDVIISNTPAIGNGTPDGNGRFSLPVKVPFHCNNF